MTSAFKATGAFAREIVAKRTAVTASISTALTLLLAFHVVSVGLSDTLTSAVAGGINVLAAVVAVLWSRDGVTPSDPALAPKSTAGEALAPVVGTSDRTPSSDAKRQSTHATQRPTNSPPRSTT
jgi:hypothetical protein